MFIIRIMAVCVLSRALKDQTSDLFQNAILNTIYRRHLNGRAFVNDPDVFFARKTNIKFNQKQKELLAKINSLLGGVIFVSDNVGDYNEESKALFKDTIKKKDIKILDVEQLLSIITIKYLEDNEEKKLRFDLEIGEILN